MKFVWQSLTLYSVLCLLLVGRPLAQAAGEENALRYDVVLDDTLRTQPGVEVLGNIGGSLKLTSDGLLIEQPPKSEQLEASGLRFSPEPTGDFSLLMKLDLESHAKSSSKLGGFFVTFGLGDGKKTAIGFVRNSRLATDLATTADFSKLAKKYFDFHDVNVSVNAISIVKTGSTITVSAGPDPMVMEELATFETTLERVDVVEVIATAAATSKPTGRYLLKRLSFVGDSFFRQPPPMDYSFLWTTAKWLAVLAFVGGGVAVGIKYDLLRKKIF